MKKETTSAKIQSEPVGKGTFLNLGLFQFLSFVRRGVFYTFMINYLFDLMHTVTFTTLLGTLNMVGSALGQNLLWGKIADRYKLRARLVILGESIAAVSYFIVFQVHRSLLSAQADFSAGLSLIVGLSFLEFFWSMSDVGWASLLTEVTTSKTRAGIVGSLNFIASLGRMIGINFAGSLYNGGEGFRQGTIFYIVIAMLFVSATIMWAASKATGRKDAGQMEVTTGSGAVDAHYQYNEKVYKWFLISLIIIVIGLSCVSQVFLLFIRLPEVGATDAEMSLILTAYTIGGMMISLACGWLGNRIGKVKVLLIGLVLAAFTPLLYGVVLSIPVLAVVYGVNGMSFWIVQTLGFALAGDIIPEDRRGRLFGKYNTVMALGWGPAGLLVGGPLADVQTNILGLPSFAAYVNAFCVSSLIVAVGTAVFAAKVAKSERPLPKS